MRTIEYALLILLVGLGVIYAGHKMSQAIAASMDHASACISNQDTCPR